MSYAYDLSGQYPVEVTTFIINHSLDYRASYKSGKLEYSPYISHLAIL